MQGEKVLWWSWSNTGKGTRKVLDFCPWIQSKLSVMMLWARSPNFISASTFTVNTPWGSTGSPEDPFQTKPFHDEFNCILSKPFKTPVLFQAVRSLFKITWKLPSRDRENPIKNLKAQNHTTIQSFPFILTQPGFGVSFNKVFGSRIPSAVNSPTLFAVPSAWIQGLPGKSIWWLHGVSKHQRHSTAQRQQQGSGAQHALRLAWFRQVTKYLNLWYFSLPWKHSLHAPCTDSPKSWAFWHCYPTGNQPFQFQVPATVSYQ